MSVELGEGLLREALTHLKICGKHRNECVCWLTGPLSTPGVIDEVLHPRHTASPIGYEIDQRWLNDTFIALAHGGRELRAQIHSHPASAYHSSTDDAFPAVTTPGFLSIVVADFAGAEDLTDAHVARLASDGSWSSVNVHDTLVIS
jgi:hypothetical protein